MNSCFIWVKIETAERNAINGLYIATIWDG
jgi:hypothetical protein